MKKSELKKIIKEELDKLNESKNYADYCFKYDLLHKFGIEDSDIEYIEKIYNTLANKIGDSGSCVLGNGITINGKIVIGSYAQGSLGLEEIKSKIIPYLKRKYPKLHIDYEWGNMD